MTSVFPLDPEINDTYLGYFWDGEFWKKQGFDSSAEYLEESIASATYLTQVNASTTYATKTELNSIDLSSASAAAVAAIVDSAPATLDTLNELAAALGDDANYASTVTSALANKAPLIPATQTGFRNAIINGDFRIDQRNAGALKNNNSVNTNASTTFGADRWLVHEANTNTVFSQRKSDGTGSDKYYLYAARPSSLNSITIAQKIESINSYHLAGKTVTLSFRASLSTGTSLTWKASYANSTDSFGTFASPTITQIATGTVTVGSTFTYNSVTFTVPSEATTGIEISFTSPTEFGVALNLSQVQLELGSIATPFEQRPIGTEISLCQRYYERQSGTSSSQEIFTSGGWDGSTVFSAIWNYATPKRIVPVVFTTTGINCLQHGIAWHSVSSIASYSERSFYGVRINMNISGTAARGEAGVAVFASSSAYAEANAEL